MVDSRRLDRTEEESIPRSPDSVLDPQLRGSPASMFARTSIVLQERNEDGASENNEENVKVVDPRELSLHKSPEDAWIVVDGGVFDVTQFLANHPGGSDAIMEHLKDEDVYQLMQGSDKSTDGHSHSKAAFEMLKQFYIGRLSSKQSTLETAKEIPDKSSTTFTVDLKKPLVFQVGHLGEAYHEWVHQAIISKETPHFFENKFLEFNTRTVWWVIPLIWLPVVCWSQVLAFKMGFPLSRIPTTMASGILLWSLIEYSLHRFLFHIKTTGYWSNTGHYLLHGCHHKFPLDGYRLVFPPAAAAMFSFVFWNVLRVALPPGLALSIFGGGLLGYVIYDLTHYFLHHGVPFNDLSQKLKSYHLNHHFKEQTRGFGISSCLWDWVFDTLPHVKSA